MGLKRPLPQERDVLDLKERTSKKIAFEMLNSIY